MKNDCVFFVELDADGEWCAMKIYRDEPPEVVCVCDSKEEAEDIAEAERQSMAVLNSQFGVGSS